MIVSRLARHYLDPPNSRWLRRSFHLLWLVDMMTAVLLIFAPYAKELNPVTVFFYDVFGFAGVALAAATYAGIVVAVGHYLSHPIDLAFLVTVVSMYLFFVFNNVIVLAFDRTIRGIAAEASPALVGF
ncbi:hypothetical protein [Halovivax asiaticus]|uniref:hypothetical protein n=1 Tax=Halovivax asiaticus TaxID=332953 RepID=UPI0006780CB5|nr:hypothetical protein [Halovivax asiaticus]